MNFEEGKFGVNATGTLTLLVGESGVAKDISAVIVKQFIMRKPDQSIVALTAVFVTDGSDGYLKYTFVNGDLPKEGKYTIQIKLDDGVWSDHTTSYEFYIRETLVVTP